MRRALFLDRDGVVNFDEGYTSNIESFHFMDGIFELCRAAKNSGYLLVVVTNQAGIGRGYYSEQDFLLLTDWMCRQFVDQDANLDDVLFCPDHPEHGIGKYKKESFDRKPNPGMLLRAAAKHSIALPESVMIGDKESDMQAALSAGVSSRWYLGSNSAHVPESATAHVCTLAQALTLFQSFI